MESVIFACDRMKVPAATLRNMGITFYPTMRNATQLKGITIKTEKRGDIKVRHISADHRLLAKVCEIFEKKHNVEFPYYGDEWGGLAVRLAEYYVCEHRPKHLNREACNDGVCYICGEPYEQYEAHHVVQPMRGGDSTNNLSLIHI